MMEDNLQNNDCNNKPLNIGEIKEQLAEAETIISTWEELNIDEQILRGIYASGYERPSPIQQRAIVPILNKRDVIAQAQSGTGKTACFVIAILGRLDLTNASTQAIILSPTRELANQTKTVVDTIGNKMPNLRVQLMVGGSNVDDSRYSNITTPHIVVGSPGRVHDMLKRRKLTASDCKIILLDEADELLTDGFRFQIYEIFQFLPTTIQVALFSATLPAEIIDITQKFMVNPQRILVKTEQLTLEGIKQYYITIGNDLQKYDTIKDIFSTLLLSQSIIYCNSVKRVQDLYETMVADNFPVCRIHSSMDSYERNMTHEDFKSGRSRVLISSNITARGIDVQQVNTVINFDIPDSVHTYLHRIGRSGRWGRKGVGINFVTLRDMPKLRAIEQYYNTTITPLTTNWASDF